MPSSKHILIVDDDERSRKLAAAMVESMGYQFETASDGEEALAKLKPSVNLILLDVMMPRMDGYQFARRVKDDPQYADVPIIMVTSLGSREDRLRAVKAGANDFITKPLERIELKVRMASLLKMKESQDAVKELWRDTLRGSIKVLSDVLALVKPDAYGRSSRISPYVRRISKHVDDPNPWVTETATMLSLLGYITLPENLVRRVNKGQRLSPQEEEIFRDHHSVALDLLSNIPRMEALARIITYQDKYFDGTGIPDDPVKGQDIPLGSRILKVVTDFDALTQNGISKKDALAELHRNSYRYDGNILEVLGLILKEEIKYPVRSVSIYELKEQMIVGQNVFSLTGNRKLIGKGQELTATMIAYLKKYRRTIGVKEPIKVIDLEPSPD